MAATEQEKPFAAAITPRQSRRVADSEDADTAAVPRSQYRRRRKRLLCCGCVLSTLLLLAILITTLALTVFHVKTPTLSIDDLTVEHLAVTFTGLLRAAVNVTLSARASIKNPNAASLKFSNFTTTIYYGGAAVGEARVPPGNARARRTLRVNVTVDVMVERVARTPNLVGDLMAGALEVESYSVVKGRVTVLGVVKKHVVVAVNCTVRVDIRAEQVHLQRCSRHVSL